MFPYAHNVYVSGGIFNAVEVRQTDAWNNFVKNHVVVEALHNSGELFEPLKCHPNTRLAILAEMQAWLDDGESPNYTMWIYGPAGAGKSSIAQKFAQILYEKRRLAGSFFFSRSSSTGRGDEKRLIGTIVYQLCQNIPAIRPLVQSVIGDDPHVFGLSMKAQIEKLIIEPLSHLSQLAEIQTMPMLIVIDGLDECRNVDGAQERIIMTLVSALSVMQHHYPHKLLIASRPEQHIKATFSAGDITSQLKTLSLNDRKWCAYDDIRKLLVDSLNKITETHPLKQSLSLTPWFTAQDIEEIVWKSSGQFIYPTVVINYIKSIRHDPSSRLKVILGLENDTKNNPFAMLDKLYSYIFSRVEDADLVLRVLCIHECRHYCQWKYPATLLAAELLGVAKSNIELAFNDLAAVMEVDYNGEINYLHASLQDFLLDKSCSKDYYIKDDSILLNLAQYCLTVLTSGQNFRFTDELQFFCLDAIIDKLFPNEPSSQLKFFQAISDANAITSFEPSPSEKGHNYGYADMSSHFSKFIVWTLEKDLVLSIDGNPHSLTGAINKILTWWLVQFQKIPYNGFDNPDGIDIWIAHQLYFETHNTGSHWDSDIFFRMWSKRIQGLDYMVTSGLTHKLNFLPWILPMFSENSQLEKYVFTRRRYISNARDAVLYFLNLPWNSRLLPKGKKLPRIFVDNEKYFWSTHLQESLQHAPWEGDLCSLLKRSFINKALQPELVHHLDIKLVGTWDCTLRETIENYIKQETNMSEGSQDLDLDSTYYHKHRYAKIGDIVWNMQQVSTPLAPITD